MPQRRFSILDLSASLKRRTIFRVRSGVWVIGIAAALAAAITARVLCSHFKPPQLLTAEEQTIIEAAAHEEQEWSRMHDEYYDQLNSAMDDAGDDADRSAIRKRFEPLKAKLDAQYTKYLNAWNKAAGVR